MAPFTADTPQDFYKLLEISPKADQDSIRQAYLTKLKTWHPDKNPDDIETAEEKTKALNEAYFTLNDAERRKQYDRMQRFTKGKKFEEYLNDQDFQEKLKQASPALKDMLDNVRELYGLFNDALKKNYKLSPARLGIIGSGLLYFIIPMDFIPDFIPLAGFLDDASVLGMVISSLKNELDSYRQWKK